MTRDLTIRFPSLGPEQDYKHGTCQQGVKGTPITIKEF
ncbi:hypothetical protein B224_3767 [Aeromonas media WS]|nr:hypothetical protein B224_3767 [Aeromonas media WS]